MVSASCHCAVSGTGSARPATVNAGRVVGVERLVNALRGESAPRTAVHVLHVYVSDLHRPLPEGILVTTPPGCVLRVPTGPSISPTSSASYPRVRSAAAADAGQRASRSESVPTPGSYVPRRSPESGVFAPRSMRDNCDQPRSRERRRSFPGSLQGGEMIYTGAATTP